VLTTVIEIGSYIFLYSFLASHNNSLAGIVTPAVIR
jgi:hypothetical protein